MMEVFLILLLAVSSACSAEDESEMYRLTNTNWLLMCLFIILVLMVGRLSIQFCYKQQLKDDFSLKLLEEGYLLIPEEKDFVDEDPYEARFDSLQLILSAFDETTIDDQEGSLQHENCCGT